MIRHIGKQIMSD